MKRTCNNCKALSFDNYCDLGYKTEKIYGRYISVKPLEQCPKPLTNKELSKLHRGVN